MARDFTVAIVGGGMCGLACAIGLARAGIQVDIYEAASKFGEIGAGVGLGPNAIRVLEKLGILKEVVSRSDQPDAAIRPFLFVSGFEGHEIIHDYQVKPEDRGLGIHRFDDQLFLEPSFDRDSRAAFLEALVHLVDPSHTHFNKRCISLKKITSGSQHESTFQLTFSDGSMAEADVVLGADGIKSVVRAFVLGLDEEAKGSPRAAYSNADAYRGLVPAEKIHERNLQTSAILERPICFVGPSKHLITFPIKGGTVLNVVAFNCNRSIPIGSTSLPPGHPWVATRSKAELLADFQELGPDVQKILQCMEQPSVWFIHIIDPPLESYCRETAAVLGDAAHGMLPHLGAGAGQGLEDVLALVSLLGHPQTKRSNVQAVLREYDFIRRPRGNAIQAASDAAGRIYEGFGPSGNTIEGMRKDLSNIWDIVWRPEVSEHITTALADLKVQCIFQDVDS